MKDRSFNSFSSYMIKLLVNETKWSILLARTRALILFISIWIFDFGPEKLPGLSSNGPQVRSAGRARLKPYFLIKWLLCLYERPRPRPRSRLLEPRSRQAGQPPFSYKPEVHKQVSLCVKLKIGRDSSRISMFLVWQGCLGGIAQKPLTMVCSHLEEGL